MTNRSRVSWCLVCTIVIGFCVAGFVSQQPADADAKEGPAQKANVFVHPEKLTAKDVLLAGGKGSKPIEIKSETTFIWVDLAPNARFAHGTEFILISVEGTRVVKGNWWPILNGKDLFRDDKAYKVGFPIKLPGK